MNVTFEVEHEGVRYEAQVNDGFVYVNRVNDNKAKETLLRDPVGNLLDRHHTLVCFIDKRLLNKLVNALNEKLISIQSRTHLISLAEYVVDHPFEGFRTYDYMQTGEQGISRAVATRALIMDRDALSLIADRFPDADGLVFSVVSESGFNVEYEVPLP